MMGTVARAIMRVATIALGNDRKDWSAAMQVEFEFAALDGRSLLFACGCLIASCREMPRHEQGRFLIANYAFALVVLIPVAVLQMACAEGSPPSFLWPGLTPSPGSSQSLYLADAYRAAVPSLSALWSLLGLGHLALAWLVLDRDWERVATVAALMLAVSATLFVLGGVLFLDGRGITLQAGLVAMVVTMLYVSARWHARLFPTATARPAGS
jgi:hypothetical protein